MQQPNSYNKR